MWQIPMYRLRISLFLITLTPWMWSTLKEGTINNQSWNPNFLNTVFRSRSSQKNTRWKTSATCLNSDLWKQICPSFPLCEPLSPLFSVELLLNEGPFQSPWGSSNPKPSFSLLTIYIWNTTPNGSPNRLHRFVREYQIASHHFYGVGTWGLD